MNILLMTPPNKGPVRYPNHGLAYLATYIRDIVNDIKIYIPPNKYTRENIIAEINKTKPEVVGISMYTLSFSETSKIVKLIKRIDKSIIIVAGGPHPSGCPEETLKQLPDLDFIIIGEGEIGFRKLLEFLKEERSLKNYKEFSKIPGLAWRQDDKIICNEPIFIEDLDSLGLPAYDLMPPNTYIGSTGSGFMKSKHIGFICSSRGCPRLCTFCAGSKVNSRKTRFRNPKNVVEEIKMVHDKYGIREIQFTDPDLSINKKHLRKICELMIKEKIKIYWSSAIHSASLDEKLLGLMKKSGCYMIRLGVESGSERILKMIKKGISFDRIEKLTKLINKHGIHVHAFFMIGFPTETMEDIKKTLKLSRKLKLDSASFAILQPLPGSEIFEKYINSGSSQVLNWDNFNYYKDSGFKYPFPFEKLKKIQRHAYLRFYFRPIMLLKMSKNLFSYAKIKSIIKMAKRNLFG